MRPSCLFAGQYIGSGKIFKVFMIYNNVDGEGQTLNVMIQSSKG